MSPRLNSVLTLLILLLIASTLCGCGNYVAHRMVQAPNTYPQWLAPRAPVILSFTQYFFTNMPAHYAKVGSPSVRLQYRIVEPMDYHFKVTSTNWLDHGKQLYQFNFHADTPGQTNAWTGKPRGTVVLLHGYALAEFAMAPWAMQLAQEGWRCVLVDLRGHGKSTGKQIYFGTRETHDLSDLLDTLAARNELALPVSAMGESYGASLALRWKGIDPRIETVVAIAPYAVLSNAVLNLCDEYAHWMPAAFPKAGLKRLPQLIGVEPEELDPLSVMTARPVTALFIAGGKDAISPPTAVRSLFDVATPGSGYLIAPAATHETVPYFFDAFAAPVMTWLSKSPPAANQAAEVKSAK